MGYVSYALRYPSTCRGDLDPNPIRQIKSCVPSSFFVPYILTTLPICPTYIVTSCPLSKSTSHEVWKERCIVGEWDLGHWGWWFAAECIVGGSIHTEICISVVLWYRTMLIWCDTFHKHIRYSQRWDLNPRVQKKEKATPGLPMWSPTIVLTGLDRA